MPRLNRSTGRERTESTFSDETNWKERYGRRERMKRTTSKEKNENKKLGKRLNGREREREKEADQEIADYTRGKPGNSYEKQLCLLFGTSWGVKNRAPLFFS